VKSLTIVAGAIFLFAGLATPQTSQTRDPAEFQPQTQSERLHHYLAGTFSAESVLRSAAGSAILQWADTPTEWGQGAEGYARRFGNSYAQHIMRQTIMYGAADLLHEDNRYFPSGKTTSGARLKYAVASSFLARKDDGTRRISFSRLGTYAAVAFISREWQPHTTNGAQNAASNIETTLATEVGFNIAREFFPPVLSSTLTFG
jgi:hypothetical protein